MCFDINLKIKLEDELVQIRKDIEAECDVYRQTGTGGASVKFRELMDKERDVKKQIEELPHRFNVGDGAHTANNGDCYPYRVVEVSKSGKEIKVVGMGHKAVKPADGSELQSGHQSWAVYDEVTDYVPGVTSTSTYTLRKNGRWIAKGCGLNDYWMTLHPGALFRYNWEF
jgi:hypothetical protein